MKRIQFSDLVNRQRRNLMGAAFLMIGVVYFEIKIKDGTLLGLSLMNFDTEVALALLLAFLLYHLFVFSVGAYEEYKHWQLTFTSKEAAAWNGITTVDFSSTFLAAAETLDRIRQERSSSSSEASANINDADIENLREASVAGRQFQNSFRSFPKVTAFRFWVVDIGLAFSISAIAIGFYCGLFSLILS